MERENIKLLNYIEEIFDEREEYLKVSDMGYVITILLGTDLTVTGEKVNLMLVHEGYEEFTEEDEYFSYIPKKEENLYEKCVYEGNDEKYGIIKWHYSIIPKLLNIDFNLNIRRNITRIKKKLKEYRGLFINYEIDEGVLKEELSKILEKWI